MPHTCAPKGLTMVRTFTGVLILGRTDQRSCKLIQVQGTYSPILGVCIVLRMHMGLVNALTVLVVDVVLLLAMLIGLLRHAHKSSTGIWKLLYRQVTLETFLPPYVRC